MNTAKKIALIIAAAGAVYLITRKEDVPAPAGTSNMPLNPGIVPGSAPGKAQGQIPVNSTPKPATQESSPLQQLHIFKTGDAVQYQGQAGYTIVNIKDGIYTLLKNGGGKLIAVVTDLKRI